MLAEAAGIDKIILICGYTDLRCGIDGLLKPGDSVGLGIQRKPHS